MRAADVAIPVETGPGEVAQVDFGYAGRLLCPDAHVLRHAWVFVMVLGYSRHLFAEVVFDQKATTWLQLHRRGFEAFGGVVQTLVPDNLKAAVIRAAFAVDGDSELHRSYRELARHYGCKVDPTPPYAPRKKGKVESAVKYVKRNALAGRHGEDITAVNTTLHRWCLEVAGTRTHGTTGEQPLAVFRQEEQAALRPLPDRPYEQTLWQRAKVHQDTHICFEGKLYSVPWRWWASTCGCRRRRRPWPSSATTCASPPTRVAFEASGARSSHTCPSIAATCAIAVANTGETEQRASAPRPPD